MLRACWRSKNTNFYSLWFDILYRIEKWYPVCSQWPKPVFRVSFFQVDLGFLVAKLTYPMSINHWLWWIFVNVLKWIFNKGCKKNLGISGIWSCWFKEIWFVFTVFNYIIIYHARNPAWIKTIVWLYLLYICHTVIHRKLQNVVYMKKSRCTKKKKKKGGGANILKKKRKKMGAT